MYILRVSLFQNHLRNSDSDFADDDDDDNDADFTGDDAAAALRRLNLHKKGHPLAINSRAALNDQGPTATIFTITPLTITTTFTTQRLQL